MISVTLMSETSIKTIYDLMVENEELIEMFPDLSGHWDKDKVIFSSMYNINEDTLSDDKFYTAQDLYEEDY